MIQTYSPPQKSKAPLAIVTVIVLAALGAGGYWLSKHLQWKAPVKPTPAPVVAKPTPAPKPVQAEIVPDEKQGALVITYPGYHIQASGMKNATKQDGNNALVLVHDYPLTMRQLQSKADLVVMAGSGSSAQVVAHGSGTGSLAIPDAHPGVQYSLHFHYRDGSYDRNMANFLIQPSNPSPQPAAEATPAHHHHR